MEPQQKILEIQHQIRLEPPHPDIQQGSSSNRLGPQNWLQFALCGLNVHYPSSNPYPESYRLHFQPVKQTG